MIGGRECKLKALDIAKKVMAKEMGIGKGFTELFCLIVELEG